MMERSALSSLLQAIPYFESLDAETSSYLAERAIARTYEGGEQIFAEGDPAVGLYLIDQGHVKIYKVSPDGEEHILHFLAAGNTFNDIAAFDGGANPANAAALSAVQIWLLPKAVLEDVLRRNSQLALRIVRYLAGRVRALVRQIEDLALYSVTIRLARFLLMQLENPALSGPSVTRAAIAAHLATTPESISRSLRTLEQSGAIRFDRHQIIIAREDLLRTIAAL